MTGFNTHIGTMDTAARRVDDVNLEIDRLLGTRRFAEHWADGPRSYLGLQVAGFPNLFTITGPGSPSVLTNMPTSIEQHVEWISRCIDDLRASDRAVIEPTPEAEETWTDHVAEVSSFGLFNRADSWYLGANIPGKKRVFMPYVGGVAPYRNRCNDVAAAGYEGFALAS